MGAHGRAETGLVATPVLFAVWSGLLLAIAAVDAATYLATAARTRTAADAVALAAVQGPDGADAATAIAQANDVRLEACRGCRRAEGPVEVEVSAPVRGTTIARLVGARRVHADARATTVPARGTGAGDGGAPGTWRSGRAPP